ncbi:MAG: atsA, partial [Acidobacteria bacterium]|nr:atsA [Acidobacteriota bacterium]
MAPVRKSLGRSKAEVAQAEPTPLLLSRPECLTVGKAMETAVPRSKSAKVRETGDRTLLWRALGALGMIVALAAPFMASAADAPRRPNIVIILGDDLGFADMGAFGSEIKTPNLDSLASAGVRFANFYTHATCSPTRSILLTGVDTHLNGLGNMDEWAA